MTNRSTNTSLTVAKELKSDLASLLFAVIFGQCNEASMRPLRTASTKFLNSPHHNRFSLLSPILSHLNLVSSLLHMTLFAISTMVVAPAVNCWPQFLLLRRWLVAVAVGFVVVDPISHLLFLDWKCRHWYHWLVFVILPFVPCQ